MYYFFHIIFFQDNFIPLSNDLAFPDGVRFYPDVKDGVRGFNIDPARGADTFFPFKSLKTVGVNSGLSWVTSYNINIGTGFDNVFFTVNSVILSGKDTTNGYPYTQNISYNKSTGIATVTLCLGTYFRNLSGTIIAI